MTDKKTSLKKHLRIKKDVKVNLKPAENVDPHHLREHEDVKIDIGSRHPDAELPQKGKKRSEPEKTKETES